MTWREPCSAVGHRSARRRAQRRPRPTKARPEPLGSHQVRAPARPHSQRGPWRWSSRRRNPPRRPGRAGLAPLGRRAAPREFRTGRAASRQDPLPPCHLRRPASPNCDRSWLRNPIPLPRLWENGPGSGADGAVDAAPEVHDFSGASGAVVTRWGEQDARDGASGVGAGPGHDVVQSPEPRFGQPATRHITPLFPVFGYWLWRALRRTTRPRRSRRPVTSSVSGGAECATRCLPRSQD